MAAAKLLLVALVLLLEGFGGFCDVSSGTSDGSEEWGYSDVRPGAHLFWWLYYKDMSSPASAPLVLWLQGGPGASGVGFGNFEEIGPLYTNLTERKSTWLQVAHLLFVDNPVGTGFSYVDNSSLLTTTNKEITDDTMTFLKSFFTTHGPLREAPFFIVAESYGGKYASELGVAISTAIREGDLDINFQGVALGNTWISPVDFVVNSLSQNWCQEMLTAGATIDVWCITKFAWGPLLKAVSLVDETGNDYLKRIAESIQDELEDGHPTNATSLWADLEDAVLSLTDNVDFYNFLLHETDATTSGFEGFVARHLKKTAPDSLEAVMNGPIREKLGIIPSSVRWQQSSEAVFFALTADFMLNTIDKVDELLSLGVNVTIYSGQLDLICCTTGTEAWVQKLMWAGLTSYSVAQRTPFFCADGQLAGFVKKYQNLSFYWIINAGHMVPGDNPCAALRLLRFITAGQGLARQVSEQNIGRAVV